MHDSLLLYSATFTLPELVTNLAMSEFEFVPEQVEARRSMECEYSVAKSAPVPKMPEIEVRVKSNFILRLTTVVWSRKVPHKCVSMWLFFAFSGSFCLFSCSLHVPAAGLGGCSGSFSKASAFC